MTTTNLLAWALHYARRGWHVLPLVPGTKRAAIKLWEARATTDPDQLTRWWTHTPYNIGLAAGPSGLVVIDLDLPKLGEPVPDRCQLAGTTTGVTALQALAVRHHTQVQPTYLVATPSGGWHLYHTAPPNVELRPTTGELGWKIDTRAHGGYVVAPPSVTPAGTYDLIDDRDPTPLPAWLHQALTVEPTTTNTTPTPVAATNRTAYTDAAIAGETERIRTAPRTEHNRSLSRAAFALGQLVGADLLAEQDARQALTDAAAPRIAMGCDCDASEIDRVITTSLRAGRDRPRRITTPGSAA